jgi:hypothetical protein
MFRITGNTPISRSQARAIAECLGDFTQIEKCSWRHLRLALLTITRQGFIARTFVSLGKHFIKKSLKVVETNDNAGQSLLSGLLLWKRRCDPNR